MKRSIFLVSCLMVLVSLCACDGNGYICDDGTYANMNGACPEDEQFTSASQQVKGGSSSGFSAKDIDAFCIKNGGGLEECYSDDDKDGFGADPLAYHCKGLCGLFVHGEFPLVNKGGDCDALNPKVNPLAVELCDGKDNNCDGKTDEIFPGKGVACAAPMYWGKVWTFARGMQKCVGGKVICQAICMAEICDGYDNDCDGEVDEGC